MKRRSTVLLASAALFVAANLASAQQVVTASATTGGGGTDFLAAFAGEWRGSGEARMTPRSSGTRITCKLTAVFDAAQALLSNSGRCGTTKGSQAVTGSMQATGGQLKGEFITGMDTSKLQKQKLSFNSTSLTVEAEMANEQGGKVHRLRTVLTKPQGGSFVVQSQFYDWDKATWVSGGQIAFKKQ
ncbi:MAG: hypothetical protein KF849_13065 [Rhizobiaceae bacterium]|nr:hypothetical protein [Rhizobiaceae bacterium]